MPKRVGVIVFFFSIVAAFPIGLAQSPAVEHRLAADRENRPANSSQSLDGEAAFTEWTRSHAIPLGTVEAGHGFDDIEKLGEIVGNAHIVALGEATHGTREFFQLKHRIIEFLATKKDSRSSPSKPTCPRRIDSMIMSSTESATRAG